jgi:hypothetical protein
MSYCGGPCSTARGLGNEQLQTTARTRVSPGHSQSRHTIISSSHTVQQTINCSLFICHHSPHLSSTVIVQFPLLHSSLTLLSSITSFIASPPPPLIMPPQRSFRGRGRRRRQAPPPSLLPPTVQSSRMDSDTPTPLIDTMSTPSSGSSPERLQPPSRERRRPVPPPLSSSSPRPAPSLFAPYHPPLPLSAPSSESTPAPRSTPSPPPRTEDTFVTHEALSPIPQMFRTAIPILTESDIKDPLDHPPPSPLDKEAVRKLTFSQWLHYWWCQTESEGSRSHLYTDKEYFLLHDLILTGMKVANVEGIDQPTRRWLYHKKSNHCLRMADMYYVRAAATSTRPEDRQYGRVLVDFPKAPPVVTQLNHADMHRVISYSQIAEVLAFYHDSPDGVGHRGQDATEKAILPRYTGITRPLIREYVQRCSVCQAKKRQQFQPPLMPIITNARFERFSLDLIDFNRYPDGEYCYIMQVGDHSSKFRWVRPLKNKEAASVAYELEVIFSTVGGPQILQSDNGGEFKGEVTQLCERYNVQQKFSRPYHPQTNGLIERGQQTLKMMIRKYQEANHTERWVGCLGRAMLMINTTYSRTINMSPYELMFGVPMTVECVPVCDRHLLQDSLEEGERKSAIDLTTDSPPSSSSSSSSPPFLERSFDEESRVESDGPVLRDDLMVDVRFQERAPLGLLAAKLFNVGHEFIRFGCIGGGRCCVCAVELAVTNCQWTGTAQEMEDHLDVRRQEMHAMVSDWGSVARARWSQMMYDLGFCGGRTGGRSIDNIRAEIIDGLLYDLSNPTASLGWEYLVCAHVKYQINIIAIPIVRQRDVTERWEGDTEPEVKETELVALGLFTIPYQMNPHYPFIVIYQRSEYENYVAWGQREVSTETSGGHYEVVCWKDPVTGYLTSKFQMDHPAYLHLQRIFRQEVASHATDVARQQMVETFDSNVNVGRFQYLEAVGMRTNTIKVGRKRRPPNNIPALVVQRIEDPRDLSRPSCHPTYRLLTRHGLISEPVRADGLVSITENNHTELYTELRGWVADANEEGGSLLVNLERRGVLSIEEAANMEVEDRESRPTRPPARQQPSRGSGAEEKKGEEKSEEEAKEPLFPIGQSHPIRIVSKSGRRYRVEWNDPPGELTWEPESKVHYTEEYRAMLLEWRAREQAREQEVASQPPRQRRRRL